MWTNAFAAVLLAAVVVVAVAGMRQTAVRRALVSEGPSEVELALERPLPNFALDRVPLEEAMARLGHAAGVQVLLDRRALEAAGVDPRAPVTVPPLRKATLSRVLDLAMESISTPVARIGYTPKPDHLVVSTGDVLAKDVRTRVYDVRDLISGEPQLPVFHNSPFFGMVVRGSQRGQGLFGSQSSPPEPWIDQLQALITETIAPDSWRDAGGSVGAMGELGGRLVICQSWENHRWVRILLDDLRQPAPPTPPAAVKHVWNDRLQRWVQNPDPTDPELALGRILPADARVDGPSLRAALDALGKASGAEIVLDDGALAAAGYDPDRPLDVRRRVGGQTLARALGGVLSFAGEPPLGYTLGESSLLVTTRQLADSVGITRAYDVRELVYRDASGAALPDVDAHSSAANDLAEAICQTVDPGSWREDGGTLGVIREAAGFLIVTQNLRNHEGVARTLAALRAGRPTTRPGSPPGPPAAQRRSDPIQDATLNTPGYGADRPAVEERGQQ
jgi:hypothetical protein